MKSFPEYNTTPFVSLEQLKLWESLNRVFELLEAKSDEIDKWKETDFKEQQEDLSMNM